MEFLIWFKKNYTQLIEEMKSSDHDYNLEHQSIYHLEGDVWTHSLMVYSRLQTESDIKVKIAALLHDIGKPATRKEKIVDDRHYCSFAEHDNLSTFMAIDILNHYEKDFNTKLDKGFILNLINWHQKLHKIGTFIDGVFSLTEEEKNELNYVFGKRLDLYEALVKLGRADALGRICFDFVPFTSRYDFFDDFIPSEIYQDFNNKPEAIILAGLPTSGKSTYAESLMKNKDYIYLSTDAIIMKKSKGREYRMLWDKDAVDEAELEMLEQLKDAVLKRKNIIIDRVNITEKMRRKVASIIPDKYYHKKTVSFLIGKKDLISRNIKRKEEGKHIDVDILLNKAKAFELPSGSMFHTNEIIVN